MTRPKKKQEGNVSLREYGEKNWKSKSVHSLDEDRTNISMFVNLIFSY